jgi:hypothetical protein
MSLNDIQLNGDLLADLFKKNLVIDPDLQKPAEASKSKTAETINLQTPPSGPFNYLGNNKKNILVLVHHPETVHLPDQELTLLVNMLAACKLGMDDVAVVNLAHSSAKAYSHLSDFFKSRIVFLFGITPTAIDLPVNFPQYQVQSFNKTTFLFSPSLGEIEKDKMEKSKLWLCLKKIFNV